MIRFAVVGTGWRTRFFLKVAAECPNQFAVTGMLTRDASRRAAWLDAYPDVKLVESLDELLVDDPLYVITSLPWDVNPVMLRTLAERGVPVLSETPPAASLDDLYTLYQLVEQGAKIAVAEQYHLQPGHASRIALAHSGKLGTVTQAQVSVAHGYHGISLIRRYLGIGADPVTIRAQSFTTPIIKGPDRFAAPETEEIVDSPQLIATFDFGDRFAVFDFSRDQYHGLIRGPRVLLRGERGEVFNEQATYLVDAATSVTLPLVRRQAGYDNDHEGLYVQGIQMGERWLYQNPLAPARLYDDEVAVGDCMLRMAAYARGEAEAFYPLAEACHDRYLDLMMHQAAESGQPITTEPQPWAW